MKVAFVSTMAADPWGGSEALWAAAAHRALEHGHEVLVNTFAWQPPAPAVQHLVAAGAQLVTRPRRPGRLAGLLARPGWVRAIEGFRPDAVCLSQGAPFEVTVRRATRPLATWLARSAVPFINLVQFAHEQHALGVLSCRRARVFYAAARVNAFVAARNRAAVERALGVEPLASAAIIRNPVNLADTSALPWPVECQPDHGEVRLACVARLVPRIKGQDTLLTILAAPPWRERPWRLTLAGTGPGEADLRRAATTLGLADRVTFAGHVADLRNTIWATHHALILPSTAEGTPIAMIEAMLLGRVCITSDVGGCAEWITDGESGFVGGPGVHHIAAALERAWHARNRWPQLADAARLRALQLTDPDPAGTLLDLLTSVAAGPRRT